MLSRYTKVVVHFDKFVPCCEGRVIAHQDDRARLVRVSTKQEAEYIANQFITNLYKSKNLGEYCLGDNYMLTHHPVTTP